MSDLVENPRFSHDEGQILIRCQLEPGVKSVLYSNGCTLVSYKAGTL